MLTRPGKDTLLCSRVSFPGAESLITKIAQISLPQVFQTESFGKSHGRFEYKGLGGVGRLVHTGLGDFFCFPIKQSTHTHTPSLRLS